MRSPDLVSVTQLVSNKGGIRTQVLGQQFGCQLRNLLFCSSSPAMWLDSSPTAGSTSNREPQLLSCPLPGLLHPKTGHSTGTKHAYSWETWDSSGGQLWLQNFPTALLELL